MSTRALTKSFTTPSLFEDLFKPWNEWFDNGGALGRPTTLPAVNVSEDKNNYFLSLAAPGLIKEDFNVDIEGNMLTISSEKEENKEVKDEKFTRKEYSFSSFSRSFSLPEDVKQDAIDANYENGVLKIKLPRKEEAKQITASKKVTVK
ncbi:MAG: Hsp20/alpha crystallin family protein [Flavisolibacter sp.]